MIVKHKNHKEDFKLLVSLGKGYDGSDFKIIFSTTSNYTSEEYECSYIGGEYTNCTRVDDSSVLCLLDNHGLSCGILVAEIQYRFKDTMMPDGDFKVVSKEAIVSLDENGNPFKIEITKGKSDPIGTSEFVFNLLGVVLRGRDGMENIDGNDVLTTSDGRKYQLTKYVDEPIIISREYGAPLITGFSYPTMNENGDAINPHSLAFVQKVTNQWSDGHTSETDITGSLETLDAEFEYTGANGFNGASVHMKTGVVTANPSAVATEEDVLIVTPQVKWNGVTSANTSVKAVIRQKAASVTLDKTTIDDIPVDGSEKNVMITKKGNVNVISVESSDEAIATASLFGNIITISVKANTTFSTRSVTITLKTSIGDVSCVVKQLEKIAPAIYGYIKKDIRLYDNTISESVINAVADGTAVVIGTPTELKEHDSAHSSNTIYKVIEPSLSGIYSGSFFMLPNTNLHTGHTIRRCQGSYDEAISGYYGLANGEEVQYNGIPYKMFAIGFGKGGNKVTDFIYVKE